MAGRERFGEGPTASGSPWTGVWLDRGLWVSPVKRSLACGFGPNCGSLCLFFLQQHSGSRPGLWLSAGPVSFLLGCLSVWSKMGKGRRTAKGWRGRASVPETDQCSRSNQMYPCWNPLGLCGLCGSFAGLPAADARAAASDATYTRWRMARGLEALSYNSGSRSPAWATARRVMMQRCPDSTAWHLRSAESHND